MEWWNTGKNETTQEGKTEYRNNGNPLNWETEKTENYVKKNLISATICEIRTDMERKNINRGFKKLRVWQDSVALYILACKIFVGFPFHLKKVSSNALDAAHSISRNIAEGYCRRSLKEYLNHLNIALGSCGEFCSCYESFRLAGQITVEEYEELDQLHYKVENGLLKLIESLQKKQTSGSWEDTF